jgi:hypothetical protein
MTAEKRIATLALAGLATATACALLPGSAGAETLALRRAFVDSVKDRATLGIHLEVDAHPKDAHSIGSGGDDGDIHTAGRADEVGLPLVAEILNAKTLGKAGLDRLRQTAAHSTVAVTGVWRIWFEHLGTEPQVQGDPVPVPDTSNPNHLFEIHPITRFGDVPLLDTLQPIPGYTAYPAATAFPFYEAVPATVQASSSAITIESGEGKYNYAEFYIELAGAPFDAGDGFLVLAQVYSDPDSDLALTAAPRRMVLVKGSAAAARVQALGQGRLHVLGIPRVNLTEVEAVADANQDSAPVQLHLPYEMIIVGVLP